MGLLFNTRTYFEHLTHILCICVFSFLYILSLRSRYSQVFPLDFFHFPLFYIRKIILKHYRAASQTEVDFAPTPCSSKAIIVIVFSFSYPPWPSKGLVPYKQLHCSWNYDHQLEKNNNNKNKIRSVRSCISLLKNGSCVY